MAVSVVQAALDQWAAIAPPPDVQFVYGIPVSPIGPQAQPEPIAKPAKRIDQMTAADYRNGIEAWWPHRQRD